jgi:propionyl-CoA carboxylase beta chain
VAGAGTLDGRRVVVTGDDFTVKGGAANLTLTQKQVDVERRALAERVPVVRLLDGTGGGGTVESLEEFGRTYVPYNPGWDAMVALLSAVPVVTAALGPVAGLGAVRLVTSHVSVMVRELAQVFVAGPAVVEAGMGEALDKEQLGGWRVAARAGTVDLVVDSEARRSRGGRCCLPAANACAAPAGLPCDDPATAATTRCAPWCRASAAPSRRRARPAGSVFDAGSVSSSAAARRRNRHRPRPAGRRPVAVLASDPRVYGGRDDRDGADKQAASSTCRHFACRSCTWSTSRASCSGRV